MRLVAGFLAPDRGVVRLAGQVVARDGRVLLPPEARRVGMVFQDLALWAHLTVYGNLAFGLLAQRVARPKRDPIVQIDQRRIAAPAKVGTLPEIPEER